MLLVWMLWVLLATLFVAYANGANDNFKGVATLFGSGTTDYRRALGWATLTTFAGSLTSLFLATRLVKTFSGKGLVPDQAVHHPAFLIAVILAAGFTALTAAKAGIPISTTHVLTGALVGSGLVAVGSQLGLKALGKQFVAPLLFSPFIAAGLTLLVYPLLRGVRCLSGITKESCLCIGGRLIPVGASVATNQGTFTMAQAPTVDILVGTTSDCAQQSVEVYSGKLLGISVQRILDVLHFISAGTVSFARGLNDTPKIVALLAAASLFDVRWGVAGVAVAMAIGGLISARKVTETVSRRITRMNHGQGFTANAVTAILVILASRWGLPVSTTHVSCGSLFGLGLVNGKANWKVVGQILSAWILTLPVTALSSSLLYLLLRRILT